MFENEPDLPFTHRGIRILFFVCIITIFASLAYKNRDYINEFANKKKSIPTKSRSIVNDIDKNALDYTPYVEDKKIVKPITDLSPSKKSNISAESYVLGDLNTGEIYLESNKDKVFPIASISKLIVALVAVHNIDQNKKIKITDEMLKAYGEAGGLKLDETYTVSELLYPLLLESSNDAAEALAYSYAGGYDAFVYQMNSFVKELGMNHTSFKDAPGLSSQNISSASDLFILSTYLYNNEKGILSITRNNTYTLATTADHGLHTYKAIDPFVLDPNFLGGKTGRTIEAKESMLSLFNYQISKSISKQLGIIVLRSDFSAREIDTSIIFEQFMRKNGLI